MNSGDTYTGTLTYNDYQTEAVQRAITDLKNRGLLDCTLAQAQDKLHYGWITQDDYDLLYDLWASTTFRFSLTSIEIADARQRIEGAL